MRISEQALTFDDVLLVPARSEVLPNQAILKTRLTRTIDLNIPLISAAMDTVTEARLAIAIAQEGGIGIVHKNLSIELQAAEVAAVKKYESGVIKDPITITPETLVRDVIQLTQERHISGLPVIGSEGLVGIVTKRDLRFETHLDEPVSSIMTPRENLVTVREGADKSEVIELLHRHRIERVLVVDGKGEMTGMITVKDITKASVHPMACKDDLDRLRVGAAVGTGADTDDRVRAMAEADVDVIVVDTAHGHSRGVLERVTWVKKNFPEIQVIGGNIATAAAARDLVDAGADAVKVGIGPGSICTTRIVAGVGVPQITAISNVAEALEGTGVPLIADGGIRFSGDVAKAMAAGVCLPAPKKRRVRWNCSRAAPTRPIAAWARSQRCKKVRVIVTSRQIAQTRSWCRKVSKAAFPSRVRWQTPCTSCSAGCVPAWVMSVAAPSRNCAPAPSLCRSPTPVCVNRMCTT